MLLFCSLVQVAGDAHPQDDNNVTSTASARQRRASESDSLVDMQRDTAASLHGNGTAAASKNVDILQMLSKAQDEYDKVCIYVSVHDIITTIRVMLCRNYLYSAIKLG
jgi:hypothetical protein